MTIKYLDSQRLTGVASDTKPTALPDHSILIETDTGKRFIFDGGRWKRTSVFDSLNESFTHDKQRFVEYFSGKQLPSYWTTSDITGTGTFAMADEVDGGFSIKAGATTGNASGIEFNDIRQYAHDGSVNIAVWKRVADTKTDVYTGFSSVLGLSVLNSAWAVQLNNVTNLLLWTGDASAGSQTQTDIPRDIVYHTTKLECGSADIKLTVDGVLKVTKTTNRPTVKLQPVCFVESRDATAREARIKYMECYNT